jgi:hypothetical protein
MNHRPFCFEDTKMKTQINYNEEIVPGGVPVKMWTRPGAN